LEELGWSVESGKGEHANVDEPVQPSISSSSESETTSELHCEAATFVAKEGSTGSDQSSSVKSTPESYTQCIKVPQMASECTSEHLKSQHFPGGTCPQTPLQKSGLMPTLTDQRGPSCTICPGPPEPSWQP